MRTPAIYLIITVVGVACVYVVFHMSATSDARRDDVVLYALHSRHDPALPVFNNDMLKFQNESTNFMGELRKKYGAIPYKGIRPMDTTLTRAEEAEVAKCVSTARSDHADSNRRFWAVEHIRTKNHTYLKREDAVLLEVGGNQGNDATRFVDLYNPRYIILEPLEEYTNILKKKFKDNPRVTVVNLGLGEKAEVIMVKIEGNNACATSRFTGSGGETPLYVENATAFFMKIGLGVFDIDLMTLNCEGCEFETLEAVLSTSVVNHFRNIQFGTHSTIPIKDAIPRYCRIATLLSRTHRPIYRYKLLWESWRRKDLS